MDSFFLWSQSKPGPLEGRASRCCNRTADNRSGPLCPKRKKMAIVRSLSCFIMSTILTSNPPPPHASNEWSTGLGMTRMFIIRPSRGDAPEPEEWIGRHLLSSLPPKSSEFPFVDLRHQLYSNWKKMVCWTRIKPTCWDCLRSHPTKWQVATVAKFTYHSLLCPPPSLRPQIPNAQVSVAHELVSVVCLF